MFSMIIVTMVISIQVMVVLKHAILNQDGLAQEHPPVHQTPVLQFVEIDLLKEMKFAMMEILIKLLMAAHQIAKQLMQATCVQYLVRAVMQLVEMVSKSFLKSVMMEKIKMEMGVQQIAISKMVTLAHHNYLANQFVNSLVGMVSDKLEKLVMTVIEV